MNDFTGKETDLLIKCVTTELVKSVTFINSLDPITDNSENVKKQALLFLDDIHTILQKLEDNKLLLDFIESNFEK